MAFQLYRGKAPLEILHRYYFFCGDRPVFNCLVGPANMQVYKYKFNKGSFICMYVNFRFFPLMLYLLYFLPCSITLITPVTFLLQRCSQKQCSSSKCEGRFHGISKWVSLLEGAHEAEALSGCDLQEETETRIIKKFGPRQRLYADTKSTAPFVVQKICSTDICIFNNKRTDNTSTHRHRYCVELYLFLSDQRKKPSWHSWHAPEPRYNKDRYSYTMR